MNNLYNTLVESLDKKHYVGNCVNSFDEDGDCTTNLPYRDTTDFAQDEEDAKEISKPEFEHAVHIPNELEKIHKKPTNKYLVSDKGVHMMYDDKKDIHHFFY